MFIQVYGTSVNAIVMATQLAHIGHQVNWLLENTVLMAQIEQRGILFDDGELSHLFYHLFDQQAIHLGSPIQPQDVNVLALTAEEYEDFCQNPLASLADGKLMINYSHLGLQASERLQQLFYKQDLVYIPDFLQEGNLLNTFFAKKLIVGGAHRAEVQALIREIFRPIYPAPEQYQFMSIRTAEFTKLSISGFLAMKVSYMNDLANAAEALQVDIEDVRRAMSSDERIGAQYLYPGCGFGGGNLSRDLLKLRDIVKAKGETHSLLGKIWDINTEQKEIVFRKLWTLFDCELKGRVIAFWGASFKPNTHSLAQAPSLNILEACWAQGVITKVHDPRALSNLKVLYPNQPLLVLCEDQYEAVDGAEALCLVTEWKQYQSPNYNVLKQRMAGLNIIDGRNIYDPEFIRTQGFHYIGIGRP